MFCHIIFRHIIFCHVWPSSILILHIGRYIGLIDPTLLKGLLVAVFNSHITCFASWEHDTGSLDGGFIECSVPLGFQAKSVAKWVNRVRPSVVPSAGSTARSGWGIIPNTLRF